jgi:hypothetical protein
VPDWVGLATRAESRYLDGGSRLPDDPDARQRQLARMANAASAVGLCSLMVGRRDDARVWLLRAADRYRESYAGSPPGSWGRPIGAIKARVLAGDERGAERDAEWALAEGAAGAGSPIGKYAACLAELVLGRWREARVLADDLRTHEGFPADVADALAFVAADDPVGYTQAVESVLRSFERRGEYLEEVPVADTVLVLQRLAAMRGIEVDLESELLPSSASSDATRG